MNPLAILRMKSLIMDAIINGLTWLGAAATWRTDLDYWIKIAAGASAIILSWITIYIKLKNDKKNKSTE